MSELKPLKPEKVLKALGELEFNQIRQSGSHIVLRHPDGRWVTVAVHQGEDVAKGMLRKIIRDVGITVEEFMKRV